MAKPYQIDKILHVIHSDFVKIAVDQHGTRPLQKLLTKMCPLTHERSKMLSMAIRNSILELSVNIHGNHVVQACLEIFTRDEDK